MKRNSILLTCLLILALTLTACGKLSSARAEAVRNMLVSEFGVPADQLKTVGLGYEKDPFERGSGKIA